MIELYADNAQTTIAGAINNTATSVTLSAGTGVLFPNPSAGQFFRMTFNDLSTGLVREIVFCTARSGDVCTIVRAQEGTTAANWAAGDIAGNFQTAGAMANLVQVQQMQQNAATYALDTGTANSYTAAFTPAITTVPDGLVLRIKAAHANTGASTFAPDAIGAAAIVGGAHSALQGGEIVANGDLWLQWNSSIGGGSWVIVDSTGGAIQTPAATQSNQAVTLAQANTLIEQQLGNYATDTGSANAYVVALSPVVSVYTQGLPVRFRAANANTGASTLNAGAGAVALKNDVAGALAAGDIPANALVTAFYDTTAACFLINSLVPSQVGAQYTNLASIGASVAANALTVTIAAETLQFRSTTLTSGAPVTITAASQGSLTVPSGATLGMLSGVAARLAYGWINNAGTLEPFIINLSGGILLDESTLINTTAISAGSSSNNVFYSTSARTGVAFRVRGYIDITEATAGTWASAPTLVQPCGGQQKFGLYQFIQGPITATTSGTLVDITGLPIWLKRLTIMNQSVQTSGASSALLYQLGTVGGFQVTGYKSETGGTLFTTGFGAPVLSTGTDLATGNVIFSLKDPSNGTWTVGGTIGRETTFTVNGMQGYKVLSGVLDRFRFTTLNGTDTFAGGGFGYMLEGYQ